MHTTLLQKVPYGTVLEIRSVLREEHFGTAETEENFSFQLSYNRLSVCFPYRRCVCPLGEKILKYYYVFKTFRGPRQWSDNVSNHDLPRSLGY